MSLLTTIFGNLLADPLGTRRGPPLVRGPQFENRCITVLISGSSSSSSSKLVMCVRLCCSLFSKLALLLRQRLTAFGHDVQITVRCLQTLVQAIDARYTVPLTHGL